MAERVFLHVGAPKSGTTFLQTVLWENREGLAERGILIPGKRRFDLNLMAKAARTDPSDESAEGPAASVWRRVAKQTRRWPGTAVISNEWLSLVSAQQAQQVIDALAPAETHVVFTARAFTAQVTAAWQETLKLGRAVTLPEFVGSLDRDGERWSWSTLDPAVVLARWGRTLSAERVHVVTVPPRGSDPLLLWRRFADLCGIDAAACDTSVGDRNESLTVESARLLELLGPLLRDAIDADAGHRSEPHRWIRRYLANTLLIGRGQDRIRLGDAELSAIRDRATATVGALRTAGYHVVGDLEEFTDLEAPPGSRRPDEVTAEELLEIAGPIIADLLNRVREETLRAEAAAEPSD